MNKITEQKIESIRHQRTFVMIKPDGVMRGLVGKILTRIENKGLKIVAMQMKQPTKELLLEHYPMQDRVWIERLGLKGKQAFESVEGNISEVSNTEDLYENGLKIANSLIEYMLSGPVICFVVEGILSVSMIRKIVGSTLPTVAENGTIRGDYSVDFPVIGMSQQRALHNLVHASENVDEAEAEIKLWFGDSELCKYTLGNENIMYSRYY